MEGLTFGVVLLLGAVFVAGAFLGVLLGRRSTTANEAVNRIQAEADRLREELRKAKARVTKDS